MRYIVGLLVALGLIIVLMILIFSGGKSKTTIQNKLLESYASTDAQVRVTIDGPINAVSEHQQIRITIDSNDVVYEHLTGYDGDVVDTQNFANTENSYDVFLHALRHAGFTQGDNSPALRDEKGYCPTGDRYIFELTQDDKTLERYWTTNCGGTKTYHGSANLTLTLFQAQVPGYEQLTNNIQL